MRRVRRYRTDTRYGKAVFGAASIYECPGCGLAQVAPRPSPPVLAQYYVQDYRRGGCYGSDVADVQQFPKDNLFYFNRGQAAAEMVRPHLLEERPQILDVGAGYGHILYALGQRFPYSNRVAIEFSEVCVRHLEALGLRVFTRPVEEVLPDFRQTFHLVVLSHVLEHFLDPHEVLSLVYASLVPGGLLYVEVPNIPEEALLKYPDQAWAPRFDEPHISFFSVTTLRRLLESVGFVQQSCETAGPHYTYISALRYHLPPLQSTVLRMLPGELFRFLRRQRFTKSLRVQEREESFYQRGGFRIWIRSIWKKSEHPSAA